MTVHGQAREHRSRLRHGGDATGEEETTTLFADGHLATCNRFIPADMTCDPQAPGCWPGIAPPAAGVKAAPALTVFPVRFARPRDIFT
jgi:hypothetical protein